MEVVLIVVDIHLIRPAIYRKAAFIDAVSAPSDHRPEVARMIDVVLRLIVAEHHVAQYAVLIRHQYADQRCAELRQYHCHIVFIRKRIQMIFCTVIRCAKNSFFHDPVPLLCKGKRGCRGILRQPLLHFCFALPPAYANGFSVLYGTLAGWLYPISSGHTPMSLNTS